MAPAYVLTTVLKTILVQSQVSFPINGGSIMNSILKMGPVIMVCLALMATPSPAELKYVANKCEITMRTGPDQAYKIIALVPVGGQVDVLTPGEEWSEALLADGKQGWVLSRFLTDEEPKELKLERIEKQYASLQKEKAALDQNVAELGGAKKELSADLSQTKAQLAELTKAHEALKKGSADYIDLKEKHDAAVTELDELRSHSEKIEQELNRLSNNQVYRGMLYGAGLLVLGFIVGFIVKKPKRRSGLM